MPLDEQRSPISLKPQSRFEPDRGSAWQRLRALAQRTATKRVGALGREQDQALVRVGNAALVLLYLCVVHYPIDLSAGVPNWLVLLCGFAGFSAIMLGYTLRANNDSAVRRFVGSVADVSAITYAMTATGTAGIPLFILYLTISLGTGFRFGTRALMTSAVLSLIGFGVVAAVSPVWQTLPLAVCAAVALSLVVLPAYTAHLIARLAHATKRAEEANAAKSRFLARMSHELRTPLSGILGTTDLLSNGKRLTREDRSLLEIIRDSVRVSMRQIDNVLDYSKIEAGKLIIEHIPFDLHALLNRAIRLVRAVAFEKNLRLMLRVDPAIPYRLVGDPHHLDEVLLNLLSNAIKFTDRGSVSLEAHLVGIENASALVRFEVHDTGIGIEPEALARIFEAFTQEDVGTTRRFGGTGLGTTIAKQLVELMGGQICVDSKKGKGSRFYADIRFPLDAAGSRQAEPTLSGLQVLLITEGDELAQRLSFLVDEWNVSLTTVATSAEAVGLLTRGIRLGNPVNAVLADSRAMFDGEARHIADDFLDKAWLCSTPVFLICDTLPEAARLREWGYAAVLAHAASRDTLFNALHSSKADTGLADGVVQVEPWAWRQQAGRPRPRLLIADDNRTNLMILQRILESAGYEVETANDGEEALEQLLRARYKVAIVDMHMPGMDGVTVIRQYRMMCSGAKTPIIMLTANATIDAKLESAEAGADAYLTKPATAAAVLSTIKKLLEDREVSELRRAGSDESPTADSPVIDTDVVAELARLYGAPDEMSRLLDTFEAEGGRLLGELQATVNRKNHAAFCELIHALKGNGANVGALRLTRVCTEAEDIRLLDFRREGRELMARVQDAFSEAVQALREHTTSGKPRSAGGDLH